MQKQVFTKPIPTTDVDPEVKEGILSDDVLAVGLDGRR